MLRFAQVDFDNLSDALVNLRAEIAGVNQRTDNADLIESRSIAGKSHYSSGLPLLCFWAAGKPLLYVSRDRRLNLLSLRIHNSLTRGGGAGGKGGSQPPKESR